MIEPLLGCWQSHRPQLVTTHYYYTLYFKKIKNNATNKPGIWQKFMYAAVAVVSKKISARKKLTQKKGIPVSL
jgi:hypothetical protein